MRKKVILNIILFFLFLGIFFIVITVNYKKICSLAVECVDIYPWNEINTFMPQNVELNSVKVAVIDVDFEYVRDYGNVIDLETDVEYEKSNTGVYSHGDLIGSIMLDNPIINNISEHVEFVFINLHTVNVQNLIKALEIAREQNVDVINISLGAYVDDANLKKMISTIVASGTIIIAASGNDSTRQLLYPASYDGVISVSCVDKNLNYMLYNNYNDKISISVPGEKILFKINGESIEKSGSSVCGAIVTTVITYLKCISPALNSAKLSKALEITSMDLGKKGKDEYYGYGLLNMKKLVLYLINPIYLYYEYT